MIRYALVLLGAIGTFSAAAIFQDAPAGTPSIDARPAVQNQTIIEKNSAFPVIGPVEWVQCNTNDCSDVPDK